jgi:beta-phosphoglucomutase-like phosphatase (HAD superfamily)
MTPAAMIERAGALLVDLDGTLVDSSAPVRRTWSAFASGHGLDPAHVFRLAQDELQGAHAIADNLASLTTTPDTTTPTKVQTPT